MSLSYLKQKSRLKTAAFTLLELLVVISIISMLMSIILPSLNRAREAGKRAVCLSNARQLTFAWTIYASANNDKMCASDTCWNGPQPWPENFISGNNHWVSDGPGLPFNDFCGTETSIQKGVLWPYLEQLDIYKCGSDTSGFVRSYGISHAMGAIYNHNLEWNFYRTGEITMPSQKMVFIDIELSPYRTSQGEMNGCDADGSVETINTYSNTWDGNLGDLTYRHNNGCNMSFADGHVKHWKWMDNRTMEIMDDNLKKLEEYSIDNPDLTRLLPLIRGVRDRQF